MSKQEIFNYWVKSIFDKDGQEDVVKSLVQYDINLNKRISQIVDSLKNFNIDTIGVFVNSYPGLIIIDSCKKGNYPSDVYIFWKFSGKKFLKKVSNHCEYGGFEIKSSLFFEYYQANMQKIKKEYIMPVIFSAEIGKDEKIKYSGETNSHEPKYAIYCQMGYEFKFLSFSQSDVAIKESLFYADNKNLKAYNWFLLIEKEIKHSSKVVLRMLNK